MSNDSCVRFRATVDWIEMVVSPARQTNWQTVQAAIFQAIDKTVRVDALDQGYLFNKYAQSPHEEWIKRATAFKFRLQDPARFINIQRVIDQINNNLKCEISTTITGIEVSVDAYGAGADMALAMYRGLKNPVSKNQRLYKRGAKLKQYTTNAAKQSDEVILDYLRKGWMIGLGDKDDNLYQRIYFKTTDCNGGLNRMQVEPRARVEIRLGGIALPFRTLAELKQFKFTNLSKHFLFQLRRDNVTPGSGKRYDADKVLNRCAGDALQRLSRSWNRLRKYTRKSQKMSVNFRHNCDHAQHESGYAQTSANPDSSMVELMQLEGA